MPVHLGLKYPTLLAMWWLVEMNEITPGQPVIEGTIVDPTAAERTVAFFLALSDEKVSKDWSAIGKTMMALTPAVVALAASKGRRFRKVGEIIAPGIALGKLVVEVNRQVNNEHLDQARVVVDEAKTRLGRLLQQARRH